MWEEICKIVARIVEIFYYPLHDWGMAIIMLTVVFRLLILPLMLSQTRSSFKMLKIQLPAWEENENLYHIRLQDLIDELTQKGQENQAGGGCGHPRRLSDLPLVQDHQAAVPHDDAGPLPRQTACRLTQLVPDGGGALNQLPVAAGDIAQADGEGEGAGQARVPPHPLPRLLKEKNADGLFAYHFF